MPLRHRPGCHSNPDCRCESGCDFFSDDFDRPSPTSDVGPYTEVSGDWSVVGSEKLSVSDTNAVLTADNEHPGGSADIRVRVTINLSASGREARIIVNREDASNYWYVSASAGGGAYLRIVQVVAGSPTVIEEVNPTILTDTDYVLCAAIISGQTIVGSINNISVISSDTFEYPGWGLGTGSTSGTTLFDDLVASKSEAGCPQCSSCNRCNDNAVPGIMKVVISGITNGTCTGCDGYNGTFYATLNGLNVGTACSRYGYTFSPEPCAGNSTMRVVIGDTSGSLVLAIQIGPDGFSMANWAYDVFGGQTFPCLEFVDQPLTLATNNSLCNESASTVLISSV